MNTPKAPAVAMINPKYSHNVASAIRACSCYGVKQLLWTGNRVDPSTYERLPREERMKGYKDVSWSAVDKPFDVMTGPFTPICVEITEGAVNLVDFRHPEYPLYVFGPEDGGVPQVIRRLCHKFVFIPAHHCLNLSAAIYLVLYDRWAKRQKAGLESPVLLDVLKEPRGEISEPGWEGK